MAFDVIFFIAGLIGLWLGSELVIRGSKNIASHLRITGLFIGLTIVSIGTSIPEMAVSMFGGYDILTGADIAKVSGIVVGDSIGSCLNQISIILGIVGLFGTIYITKRELLRDGLMLLSSIVIFFIISFDGIITRFEGALIILLYVLYVLNLLREEKVREKVSGRKPKMHLGMDLTMLAGGLWIVVVASKFVVDNGILVAESLGVSTSVIGIMVIGLSTGLPELVISISAIRHKEGGIAVGNLIGSNITDLLFALGSGAVLSGFVVSKSMIWFDAIAMLIIAVVVIILFATGKKLSRKEAVLLILMYMGYAFLKFKGF